MDGKDKQITITIEGPRQVGKTTLAGLIYSALKGRGIDPELRGVNYRWKRQILSEERPDSFNMLRENGVVIKEVDAVVESVPTAEEAVARGFCMPPFVPVRGATSEEAEEWRQTVGHGTVVLDRSEVDVEYFADLFPEPEATRQPVYADEEPLSWFQSICIIVGTVLLVGFFAACVVLAVAGILEFLGA